MPELTEDTLAAARCRTDDEGYPLATSKVVCGERAALRARRILSGPTTGPFAGAAVSMGVEINRDLGPDDWRVE